MKLSLAFGIPLFILRDLISSEELTLWRAYDEQDPISLHHRIDLAAGVIASVNVNKGIPKGEEHTKPSDFMPVLVQQKLQEDKATSTARDLRSFLRGQILRNAARKKEE